MHISALGKIGHWRFNPAPTHSYTDAHTVHLFQKPLQDVAGTFMGCLVMLAVISPDFCT